MKRLIPAIFLVSCACFSSFADRAQAFEPIKVNPLGLSLVVPSIVPCVNIEKANAFDRFSVVKAGDMRKVKAIVSATVRAKNFKAFNRVVSVIISKWDIVSADAEWASNVWALAMRGRMMEERGEDTTLIWKAIEDSIKYAEQHEADQKLVGPRVGK